MAQAAEVIVVAGGQGEVGAAGAEQGAEQGEGAAGGRGEASAGSVGGAGGGEGAQVAGASLRISPMVIARMPSASSSPAAVAAERMTGSSSWLFLASMVRPASAAMSRAAASCALVRGWLVSMSQPARLGCQPDRRRPAGVINEVGEEL